MMRILLLAGFGLLAFSYAEAQNQDSSLPIRPKTPPTQQAARQLKNLEKQLHLTQDQVLELQVILINRDVAMDSLRNSPSTGGHSVARTRQSIRQQADRQIDSLLTNDQKVLYQQWKQQQKERAAQRHLNASSVPQ
jgi:hypothetical protein